MKETEKGADKTQGAAGTLGHVHSCGGRQPCAPHVFVASAVPQTCSKFRPSSDSCTASVDLAVLQGVAGNAPSP